MSSATKIYKAAFFLVLTGVIAVSAGRSADRKAGDPGRQAPAVVAMVGD